MKEERTYFNLILTLVYCILKMTKVINWSWWWVLSPLWIKMIYLLIVAMCIGIIEIGKN